MTDVVAVDPSPYAPQPDEKADGPLIPMVVSLTFPGMTESARDLQDELTRAAFNEVRAAGGRPRLVIDSTGTELKPASEVFEGADGIIFLGGADVDESCYNYSGPIPDNLYGVDRRSDDYCIGLFHEAAARDLPTLAICRGSQLMNVAFGGTLIPDIAEYALHHGEPGGELFVDEEVNLVPGSKISQILGRETAVVRNGHHQAVNDVAPELVASAIAHDGIVEGTEHPGLTWMVGMQWHPEEAKANVQDRERIFGALVAQAAGTAAAKAAAAA